MQGQELKERVGTVKIKVRVFDDNDNFTSHSILVTPKTRNLLTRLDEYQSKFSEFRESTEELILHHDFMKEANCHKTALLLSGEITWEEYLAMSNTKEATAGHEMVYKNSKKITFEDLPKALSTINLPTRITFENEDGSFSHSIYLFSVVEAEKGRYQILAFDKSGPYSMNPYSFFYLSDLLKIISSKVRYVYLKG